MGAHIKMHLLFFSLDLEIYQNFRFRHMLVIKQEQIRESTLQNYEHFIESKTTINDSNSAGLIQLGKQDSNEESVMLIGLILHSMAEFYQNSCS